MFYDALGGARFYAKQPHVVKADRVWAEASLILKRYPTARPTCASTWKPFDGIERRRSERRRSTLFFEQEHLDDAVFALGGGVVALHSSRSPGERLARTKTPPASSPRAADRAVLAVADGLGGAPAGAPSVDNRHQLRRSRNPARHTRAATSSATASLNGFEAANEEVLTTLGVGAATTLTAVVEIDGPVGTRRSTLGDSFMLLTGQRGKVKSQTIPHSPTRLRGRVRDFSTRKTRCTTKSGTSSATLSEARRCASTSAHPSSSQPNDTLVVASDGLSDNLAHAGDHRARAQRPSSTKAVAQAIARAAPPSAWRSRMARRRRNRTT